MGRVSKWFDWREKKWTRVLQSMGSLVLKLLLISVVFCDHGEAMAQFAPQTDLSLWKSIGPEALLERLDKLLDVCIENYEDLTTDLLLGVAIANGKTKLVVCFS